MLFTGVDTLSFACNTEQVTKNIQIDLKHQLKSNQDRIINRYALFVSRLCDSIHDKKVGAMNLRTFIFRSPAIEGDAGKESVKEKLLKASTINEIIDLIGNECASFLHCDIYQSILEKYCSDIDHDELKYSEHLKAYINSIKVSEFLVINPELKKLAATTTNTIAVKVDIVMSSKFVKIVDLQTVLASILGVWPSKLTLVSIEEGCVIVTFTVPAKILEKERLKENSEELQSLSVLWLKCGNYKLDFQERSLSRHRTHRASIDKAASIASHYDYLPPSKTKQPPKMSTVVRHKSSKTKYDYLSNPRNAVSLKHPTARTSLASHSWYSATQHQRVIKSGGVAAPYSSYNSTGSASDHKKHSLLQHYNSYKPAQSRKPQVGVTRVSSLRLSRDVAPVPVKYATIPRQTKTATHSKGVVAVNSKIGRGGSTASEYNHRQLMYRFRTSKQKHRDLVETSSLRPPSLSLESTQRTPSFNIHDKKRPPKVLSSFRHEGADSSPYRAQVDAPSQKIVRRVHPPKDSPPESGTYIDN